jgi:quinol monooxygenase YgiN
MQCKVVPFLKRERSYEGMASMRRKIVVALLIAGLLAIVAHRLVIAQEAKRQVVVWHTITWKANADAKAREEMKKLLETKLFPAAARARAPGLIRFTVLRGSSASVETVTDDNAYREPATYALIEVWKDAESAKQFRLNLPEDLKAANDALYAMDPDSVLDHRVSMYDEFGARPAPAAQ